MGSEGKTNPRKPHYNISMSRRTIRPLHLKIEPQESLEQKDEWKRNEHPKSLKQLIEGRCPLAQHFREEEENQGEMVVRQSNEDGFEGVKTKRVMRNYARVLSQLIKVKQESYFRAWTRYGSSLKLIKHK